VFGTGTTDLCSGTHANCEAATSQHECEYDNCHWGGCDFSESYGVIQVATACAAEYNTTDLDFIAKGNYRNSWDDMVSGSSGSSGPPPDPGGGGGGGYSGSSPTWPDLSTFCNLYRSHEACHSQECPTSPPYGCWSDQSGMCEMTSANYDAWLGVTGLLDSFLPGDSGCESLVTETTCTDQSKLHVVFIILFILF